MEVGESEGLERERWKARGKPCKSVRRAAFARVISERNKWLDVRERERMRGRRREGERVSE